jgi:hypothetical protein
MNNIINIFIKKIEDNTNKIIYKNDLNENNLNKIEPTHVFFRKDTLLDFIDNQLTLKKIHELFEESDDEKEEEEDIFDEKKIKIIDKIYKNIANEMKINWTGEQTEIKYNINNKDEFDVVDKLNINLLNTRIIFKNILNNFYEIFDYFIVICNYFECLYEPNYTLIFNIYYVKNNIYSLICRCEGDLSYTSLNYVMTNNIGKFEITENYIKFSNAIENQVFPCNPRKYYYPNNSNKNMIEDKKNLEKITKKIKDHFLPKYFIQKTNIYKLYDIIFI